MSKPLVIPTRRWPEETEARMREHFEVRLNENDEPFTKERLKDALCEADALFPTVTDKVDADVLSVEPLKARLIGNYGVGFNNIDTDAAKERGLVVTNTPEVLTDATAELALTLLLAIARRVGEGERHVRAGAWSGWRPTHMLGNLATGKTLGVVGFGRIGRKLAQKAHHGFEMKVLAYDPYPPKPEVLAESHATVCENLEEVFERADFVSIHCPATPENRHLVNAERLARMGPHAYLINTARGDIVDEAALIEALQAKRIAGAGLDVYEAEPKVSEGLLDLENVVLLPHLGSATIETRIAMGMRVIDNAIAFFASQEPRDRVA